MDIRNKIGTIDITPSWVSVLPLYLNLWAEKQYLPEGAEVLKELERMAKLADLYVAQNIKRA